MAIILVPLPAQERSNTGLYITPTTGGTLEERQFFDDNIPMEVLNANYRVVYTPQEADYIINMTISEDEDYDNPGGILKVFTISVIRTITNTAVVEYSWGYREIEEMYNWNLFLVYNALANITLTNPSLTTQPTPAPPITPAPPETPEPIPLPWWNRWLYVGFRAAPAFTRYFFLPASDYPGDNSTGIGVEGGLTTEFRPFRFLSFQLDALLSYDSLIASRIVFQGNTQSYITDGFSGLSLMVPFLVKVFLPFEKFTLSPYAGPYYATFVGPLTKISGDTKNSEEIPVYKTPLLGGTIGTDIGFRLGPGELFVDLRYSRNFGEIVVHNDYGLRYTQERITLSLGYKFGLFKRGAPRSTQESLPPEDGEEVIEEI
jgi:hypothetical protein